MTPAFQLNGNYPAVDFTELESIAGVRTTAVMLTPQIAERLLKRNVRNRKVSDKVIKKYVAEIQAGEWRLTSQGIGFDDVGRLTDGQHRLHAIVRANQPVPMLVTVGLPFSGQEKVDRLKRRSLFDVLFLAGHAVTRQEVEIATCILRMRLRSDSGVVPSDCLVKEALECHKDHIRAVLALMKGANKSVKGLSQASFLAAATLYHEMDAARCAKFLECVRKGTMLTEDHPAMRLRRFLLGETTVRNMTRGGANQSFIFRRAIYAMQAHLEGRNISGLREAEDISAKPGTAAYKATPLPFRDPKSAL